MESIQVETEKTKDKENSLVFIKRDSHDEPVCVVQPASKDTTNGVCIQPHTYRYLAN